MSRAPSRRATRAAAAAPATRATRATPGDLTSLHHHLAAEQEHRGNRNATVILYPPEPETATAVLRECRALTKRLPRGTLIGLLDPLTQPLRHRFLLDLGAQPQRQSRRWIVLTTTRPTTLRRRALHRALPLRTVLRTVRTARQHKEWPLIIEQVAGLLHHSQLPHNRRGAALLAAYLQALWQQRRIAAVRRLWHAHSPWLLADAADRDLRRAATAYFASLARLNLSDEIERAYATLPPQLARHPKINAEVARALLKHAPQTALAYAERAVTHATPRHQSQYLGQLLYAEYYTAYGHHLSGSRTPQQEAQAETLRAHYRDWQTALSARSETVNPPPQSGFLEAALASHCGDPEPALAALNRELSTAGLAPLTRRDPGAPLSPDNLTTADPVPPDPDESLVSVIMSAYNAAPYLDTAIASALAQSHRRLELLIIDDGSHDATLERALTWQQRDPRIRIIAMAENAGVFTTRNIALRHTRGDCITTLDADDWAHPQRIERLLHAVTTGPPGVIAAMGSLVRLSDHGCLRLNAGGSVNGWDHSSLLFTRRAYHELGGFDPVTPAAGGDVDFKERLLAHWGPTALRQLRDHCLLIARDRADSLTMTKRGPLATDAFEHNSLRLLHLQLLKNGHQNASHGRSTGPATATQRTYWVPRAIQGTDHTPGYRLYEPL
ncbi:hypothetical protein CKO15_07170 [Halorhodospira abdelmalekii]|uniref:glycosyltransferase family 2 protein n=1 Tax=Halorhodospira abdelmalekii TaxID=421629 RepID=UPI0019065161|nr:glycosyltransferase family 2 protein [Halorhodospira abdelmalekii]MBK1735068.1 hypothetical protein [Halorhodospira abdelmalekii]